MTKKYAIIIRETGEFYPDPLRESLEATEKKVQYLREYRKKNDMPVVNYAIEQVFEEREAQHKKEWDRYVSMLD